MTLSDIVSFYLSVKLVMLVVVLGGGVRASM